MAEEIQRRLKTLLLLMCFPEPRHALTAPDLGDRRRAAEQTMHHEDEEDEEGEEDDEDREDEEEERKTRTGSMRRKWTRVAWCLLALLSHVFYVCFFMHDGHE